MLEFLDENNVTVKLDTTQLREKLEKIKRMYLVYERTLSAYEIVSIEEAKNITKPNIIVVPTKLTVYASKLNPFVYENVTFYGYALGFNEVKIHIGNESFTVSVKNNYFSLKHVFKQVGSYRVFATGMKDSKIRNFKYSFDKRFKDPNKFDSLIGKKHIC